LLDRGGAGGREPCLHFAVMAHEFRLRGLGKLQHSRIE